MISPATIAINRPVHKFHCFILPDSSLPCSLKPSTGPHAKPLQSIPPHTDTKTHSTCPRSIFLLLLYLMLFLPFSSPTKKHLLFVLHVPPISSCLVCIVVSCLVCIVVVVLGVFLLVVLCVLLLVVLCVLLWLSCVYCC